MNKSIVNKRYKYVPKESKVYIENFGDILTSYYYHIQYPNGIKAIGDCDAKRIDNKDWDIFHIHYETEDAYYGMPMLGIGLMDCMILKSDTRPFLPEEIRQYNLITSNGKYEINIRQIENKWK